MNNKTTRRRVLQAAGLGAALPLLGGSPAEAGEPASADQALLSIVRQRFKHLTEDQLKAVQRGLLNGIASAETLKRVRLDPLDEPASVFVADVAE
jgi:hypothetical protein